MPEAYALLHSADSDLLPCRRGHRRAKWTSALLSLAALAMGCSSDGDDTGGQGTGGTGFTGGAGTGGSVTGGSASGGASSGGTTSTGGAQSSGGTQSTGGTTSSGGVTSTGGAQSSGGAQSTGGAPGTGGSGEPCAQQCVEQCEPWGGTPRDGVCEGSSQCCEGATEPVDNPLAHLVDSAQEVGLLLANRFRQQNLSYNSVANLPGDGYKNACEWYGSLGVANLTDSQDLLDGLVSKFDPFKTNFVQAMNDGEAHVDRYIYGMVPLEIYLQTGDESYLELGTQTADRQQVTNQTRNAIDDMFMMTGLQLQAYRATGDVKYINFMSDTMVDYLGAQQANGLFFHNVNEARVYWGRGNGWFAAGMAEMMRDLPLEHDNYTTIEAGYKAMMEGLLPYQSANGLWYQVLDMPDNPSNWEESSGTAMFTYAMVAGVRRGVLNADTYVPVIEDAWEGLRGNIDAQGAVSSICVGTWYKASAAEYMGLTRLTGDGHGQAPVLWIAAELLR